MKKLLQLIGVLLIVTFAMGQNQPVTGTITTATAGAGNCVTARAQNNSAVGIDVSGIWSGTLQPTVQIGSITHNKKVLPLDGSTSQSTITSNNLYIANVGGVTQINVCASAWSSGSATVTIYATPAPNNSTIAAGGSGSGVTSLTATAPVVASASTGAVTLSLRNSTPANITALIGTDTLIPTCQGTLSNGHVITGDGNGGCIDGGTLLSALLTSAAAQAAFSGHGACTNQAVTAVNANAAPTCSTITSSYIDSSIETTAAAQAAFSGHGSCTNQAVTAANANAAPSCSTITSAYVDTSIAKTGSDINTSNQVTGLNGTALSGLTGALKSAAGTITAISTTRSIQFPFGTPGGSALSTGTLGYMTVPFACTITGWAIAVDAGTATVKFWKVAAGTAIPTSGNSISTSGVSISTGTVIQSTTLSDFTTTTVSANDIIAVNMGTTSGVGYINVQLSCQQ